MSKKRQISGIITALAKSAGEKTGRVKASVLDSLCEIGKHEPNEVLTQCKEMLNSPTGAKVWRVINETPILLGQRP